MGDRPFTKLLFFFILFMLFYITLYDFLYIPIFWENFHKELSTTMGKFSHKIIYLVKSMGKFSQRIFNERNDKNRKLYLLI